MTSHQTIPRYVQVSETLIRDIAAGRLLDGQRLPPERDMARDLGISVGTLRKALAALTQRGLLERVQGSGNYVRHGGDTDGVYAMFRLELPTGGGLPRADVLSVSTMQKPGTLPGFGQSRRATRIRRLRYLNDVAIAVEEIWLDAACGLLSPGLLSDSLYGSYRKHLGLWITRAEDRVGIGIVPRWAPEGFGPLPGETSGYIERMGWAEGTDPVEFSRTWFDTARAVYVQRMK